MSEDYARDRRGYKSALAGVRKFQKDQLNFKIKNMSLNRCEFVGHVGNDAREYPDKKFATFQICVRKSWMDKERNWKEKETWVPCKISGKKYDQFVSLCRKGNQLFVIGEFDVSKYETESGPKESGQFLIDHIRHIVTVR